MAQPPRLYNDPPPELFRTGGKGGKGAAPAPDDGAAAAGGLSTAELAALFRAQLLAIAELPAAASGLNKKALEDTSARMEQLYARLEQGVLSPPVLAQLRLMADAVQRDELQRALDLHVPLMTGHYDETAQWLVGLKRVLAARVASRTAAAS